MYADYTVCGIFVVVRQPNASGRFGMQELQELPFTPVHAPIMAVVPGMHRCV